MLNKTHSVRFFHNGIKFISIPHKNWYYFNKLSEMRKQTYCLRVLKIKFDKKLIKYIEETKMLNMKDLIFKICTYFEIDDEMLSIGRRDSIRILTARKFLVYLSKEFMIDRTDVCSFLNIKQRDFYYLFNQFNDDLKFDVRSLETLKNFRDDKLQ